MCPCCLNTSLPGLSAVGPPVSRRSLRRPLPCFVASSNRVLPRCHSADRDRYDAPHTSNCRPETAHLPGVCLELLTHNPSRATTNPSLRHQNCQGVDVSNMPNHFNLDGKLVRNRSPSPTLQEHGVEKDPAPEPDIGASWRPDAASRLLLFIFMII